MKKSILWIFLLCSVVGWGQNFDKHWGKVAELEQSGKYKSALAEVASIYKKAIKGNDEPQIIKTFFLRSKYMMHLEEDAQLKIIGMLQQEKDRLSMPSQAILECVYGKILQSYYSRNQYLISRRTNIDSLTPANFKTWTSKDFEKQIAGAYDRSLDNKEVLWKTPLKDYEIIFFFEKLSVIENKTVYDFIIEQNIKHQKETVRYGTVCSETDCHSIYDHENFVAHDFLTGTDQKTLKIINLYKDWMRKRPGEKQLVLEFLTYFHNFCCKDKILYLAALDRLLATASEVELQQEILLQQAITLNNSASKDLYPVHKIRAVAILDSLMLFNNRTNAYKSAYILKENIQKPEVSMQLLKYIYENENTRIFITHKNTQHLKFGIYKVPAGFLNEQASKSSNDSLAKAWVLKSTPHQTFEWKLEKPNDYFDHSTESLFPPLPKGKYLVYCHDPENETSTTFAYEIITVTNLVVTHHADEAADYFEVADRKTGDPVANAKLSIDGKDRMTNQNGLATVKKPIVDKSRSELLEALFSKNADSLVYSFNTYLHPRIDYDDDTDTSVQGAIHFYLDRAIYRPGQKVYGKGIVFQTKNGIKSVVPNLTVLIEILDPGYQTMKEFEVQTNEFGSFVFEFDIPKNGMTGDFSIRADEPDDYTRDKWYDPEEEEHLFWDFVNLSDSQISFSVEEYKRPTFEVDFEPVTEAIRLEETVTVTGQAMAYSGSMVSNAKVKYRVERKSFADHWQRYPEEVQIIEEDEIMTDSEGKFKITFEAAPSPIVKNQKLPVFHYNVIADVTDINGETRSKNTVVKAGYHSLSIQATIPSVLDISKKNKIFLATENLNGQPVPSTGDIKIYYQSPFDLKFKPRTFPSPENSNISKAEFEKLFPYEPYGSEKPEELPDGKLVFSKTINTPAHNEIPLDFASKWLPGNYRLVFTVPEKSGTDHTTIKNFTLIDSRKSKLTNNMLFAVQQLNENPYEDGFIHIQLTAAVSGLSVSASLHNANGSIFKKQYQLKNGVVAFKVPLKENAPRTLKLFFESHFENSHFSEELLIEKKIMPQEIGIELMHFNNKLEPGKEATWSFKLSHPDKRFEAEALASMYDSSLDQFREDYWSGYKPRYYSYISGPQNHFTYGTSSLRLNSRLLLPEFYMEYKGAHLIWYGFNINDDKINAASTALITKTKIPKNAQLVSGYVIEGGMPLPGATVLVKGTPRGVSTDFDGYFEINAAIHEELEFSYVGMINVTVPVSSNTITVAMVADENVLQAVELVTEGYNRARIRMNTNSAITTVSTETIEGRPNASFLESLQGVAPGMSIISSSGSPGSSKIVKIRGLSSIDNETQPLFIIDGIPLLAEEYKEINPDDILDVSVIKDASATTIYGSRGRNGVIIITTKQAMSALKNVVARKNLQETAFFYPQLLTDREGKISFNFTSPESLTEWKFRLFAHDKKAVNGYLEKTVITQKDLMITPNLPRFLREKDSITISTKIANLTNETQTGMAMLQLLDAATMEPVTQKMLASPEIVNFSTDARGNTTVSWKLFVPEGLQALQYKIVAKAGNFSDGEESILPVVKNSMLVTESIPIWVRENSKRDYSFDNLKNNNSVTLQHHQLTLEYTSNPTWLAIQSLPYLMEFEHNCAEQTFARLYANALAAEIIASNPKIEAVFEQWKKHEGPVSKLQQNEELKSILLAETPWLMDGQSESEQKKTLALLFDLDKTRANQKAILDQLTQMQKDSGGFGWFEGSDENEYITRHIISGLGHLESLIKNKNVNFDAITKMGVAFLDDKFVASHSRRKSDKNQKMIWPQPYNELHYLYSRSFYLSKYPMNETLRKTSKLYINNVKENWMQYSLYEKALATLTLYRFDESAAAKKILVHLKESSANNEDWGMYWIANKAGWYWHQAPIETQALLIEAFAEVGNDKKSVDAMKVWLLKNKQTKNWPTTKATTEAVYALLLQGSDWVSAKDKTVIKWGDSKIFTQKLNENEKEAGTGYIKMDFKSEEINSELATVTIENKSAVPGFGGFYWQYFEELDQIKTGQQSTMTVSKELYLQTNTTDGKLLKRITRENPLKIGDLVTIRLVINTKEDIDFVHLKDMRASAFEPIDVLSKYERRDGLGFYKSTKDLATHFFFDRINKGTYVLEYDVRVNNLGDFSNGITTIQSMYAPEFSSHTKGIRVQVAK